MNTSPPLSAWMSGRRAALGAAVSAVPGPASVASLLRRSMRRITVPAIAVLLAGASVATLAGEHEVNVAASRVADVSLADLDVSTPTGMKEAQHRLHAMAERVCGEGVDGRSLSSQPNFTACVDSMVAEHVKQIDSLRRINMNPANSVTHAANVSLTDLDLSTLEGSRIAHERLETMARRLCSELVRSRAKTSQPTFQPTYGACVQDTLASAWGQANALRAAHDARTVQRLTP